MNVNDLLSLRFGALPSPGFAPVTAVL